MAAIRYTWMFRIAAALSVLLGLGWLWTATLSDYRPDLRPYLLAVGLVSVITGIYLFRRARFAVGLSAAAALVVSVSAMLFIPEASGPGVLFLVALAVIGGLYAALSFRVLFSRA